LIYVSRRISTSSHRQVPCNHPDLTAIKIRTPESQVLFFSGYIPPVALYTPEEASAEAALQAIKNTTQRVDQVGA
jgi:hypothetical protein